MVSAGLRLVRRASMGLLAMGCVAAPCELPSRSCPADAPHDGNACEGALECFYVHPDLPADPMGSRFTCEAGVWREELLCEGCTPRRSEACREPDVHDEPGEVHIVLAPEPIVFGAQGAAMIVYHIELDAPRSCVSVRETTSIDGMEAPGEHTVALHCGVSRTIYALLYDLPCTAPSHAIGLTVDVEGVGTASATFEHHGEGCPLGP